MTTAQQEAVLRTIGQSGVGVRGVALRRVLLIAGIVVVLVAMLFLELSVFHFGRYVGLPF